MKYVVTMRLTEAQIKSMRGAMRAASEDLSIAGMSIAALECGRKEFEVAVFSARRSLGSHER